MQYYGTKISPHRIKNDEGFLHCLEVPVARTGTQFYLSEEIEFKDKNKATSVNGGYEVMRTEDEVFSSKTLSSFEGKPLTDEHPDELVTSENSERYIKGTVKNVKRGTGELKDFILADLVVYDGSLIKEIENGKVGVSVGYLCTYEIKDNQLFQKDIICNHIAVVDEGRAGEQAVIRDKKTEDIMPENIQPKEECKKDENEVKVEQKDLDPNADILAKIEAMLAPLTERIERLENGNKKDSLDELKEEAMQKAKEAEQQDSEEEQPQVEQPQAEKEPESDEENVTASPEKIEEIASDTYSKVIAGVNKIKPIIAKLVKGSKEQEIMKDSVRDILRPFMQKNKQEVKKAVNSVYKPLVQDNNVIEKKTIYEYQKQFHPKYKQ